MCQRHVGCHSNWTGETLEEMLLECSGSRLGMLKFLPCIIPFYKIKNYAPNVTHTPVLRKIFSSNRNCGKLVLVWLIKTGSYKGVDKSTSSLWVLASMLLKTPPGNAKTAHFFSPQLSGQGNNVASPSNDLYIWGTPKDPSCMWNSPSLESLLCIKTLSLKR